MLLDPDWITATRALDRDALSGALQRAHATCGLVAFLEERVGPFLVEVGLEWEHGALRTYHEHFASELLRDFLAESWRPLAARANGPSVVFATLPGELHVLGLHMAAAVLALAGCRPVFLGANTPLPDLRDAALASGARAVVVSLSAAADPTRSRADLAALRTLLPPAVALAIGGSGAPKGLDGVLCPASFAGLPSAVGAG